MSQTTVSSPGKVLIAGGYLVLDPAYSGVVVSTSSRFYTIVAAGADSAARGASRPIQIHVRSPQFEDATWSYVVHIDNEAANVRLEQVTDDPAVSSSKNKFVQLGLERTLSLALESRGAVYLKERLSTDLRITIVGDNDFYSQRAQLAARNLPPTLQALSQLPPFLPTGATLSKVHKTGLGSSAALITSLVSGLLLHLGIISPDSFEAQNGPGVVSVGRRLAHNLAQYIHCLAQGKVGSGFDVSSAVFGSQLYTRFNPAVLQPLMSDDATSTQSLSGILAPANSAWDYRVEPFKLPPFTRLMLADVDAGSDTPSLVGKVLKWRKEDGATANALWSSINELNQGLGKTLLALSQLEENNRAAYKKVIKYLSTLQFIQWLANPNITEDERIIIEAFTQVHQLTEDIRAKMREMGTLAGVPIEPPEQTQLLDACVSVAGVIGGGVPGAGGYDAIWLLVLDPLDCPPEELPSSRIQGVWASWEGLDVSPLLASESVAKGARVENLEDIPGLNDVVRTG